MPGKRPTMIPLSLLAKRGEGRGEELNNSNHRYRLCNREFEIIRAYHHIVWNEFVSSVWPETPDI